MKCRKCGSGNMGVMPNKKNPSATDLYCLDCGAWQKFATKDEIRLYQCKKGPITNADRIRVMSDEDMAIWLAEWSFCADACPASTNEVEEAIGYCCPSNCKEQALTWLQQPAEEEP